MAKYCKYCGKELKDKEPCSCQTNEIKTNTQKNKELQKATETLKNEVSDSSKKYAEKVWNIIKNIFSNPKETMQEFIEQEDNMLTFIILILSSLLIGICAVSFLKGIYASIITQKEGSSLYSIYPISNSIWDISYFKILLCVAIGMFLGYILLAIIFELGFEKISQIKLSFKNTLAAIAISSLEPTIFCLIGAFLTIISYKLALIIIIYAFILYLINLYQSFREIKNIESAHYNHIFAILILIFGFLAIYLIPNLFL